MKSLVVSLVAVGLLVACGGGTAATQPSPTPSGPLTKYKNTLPGLNATGVVDLTQNVIDFGPGAESVVHTHSTPNLGTVLEGQITVKMPASDKRADAGGMLVEPINQPLQAVNTGSGEAMVVVAFAVPRGSKPTTPVAGRPAPATVNKTLYSSTLAGPGISGPYSLVQQVLDFAPGSQSLKYRYGGPGLITVLQGQATVSIDGVYETFGAGETFTEMPIQKVQLFNRGSEDVVLAATFMLPDDAQLTTNP
jgi:quercetin dioxygenase-like cupin family protein